MSNIFDQFDDVATASKGNPFDQFDVPVIAPKVVGSAFDNPDQAAKALELSKRTRIPYPLIQPDPEAVTQKLRVDEAGEAARHPTIGPYLQNFPAAAQVSNDDYPQLAKIAAQAKTAEPQPIWTVPQRMYELVSTPGGMTKLLDAMNAYPQHFIEGMKNWIETYGVADYATGAKSLPDTYDPEALDVRAEQQVSAGFNTAMLKMGTPIKLGRTAQPKTINEFLDQIATKTRGTVWREEIDAFLKQKFGEAEGAPKQLALPNPATEAAFREGREPPVGADPVVDSARAVQAHVDTVAIDNLMEAAKESKTRTRSPDAFNEFAKQATGDIISVPGEKLAEIYGQTPDALSWIPDVAARIDAAVATGGDVSITLADYMTWAGDLHEGLRDDLRTRANGLTINEGKEIEGYHGTPHDFEAFSSDKIGTGEGAQSYGHGHYIAESKNVAVEYKKSVSNKDFIRKARELYSEFDDPADAIDSIKESGDFTPQQKRLLAALEKDDWLGFEYPHQAVSAVLRNPKGLELSPETQAALDETGNLLKVKIKAIPEQFLDFDKPLSEQSPYVQAIINRILPDVEQSQFISESGENIYKELGEPVAASALLRAEGIQGLKYRDQHSRRAIKAVSYEPSPNKDGFILRTEKGGSVAFVKTEAEAKSLVEGTRNYVVFDDSKIQIIEKNGQPVANAIRQAAQTEMQASGLRPLFADQAAAGMTKAQFDLYNKRITRQVESIEKRANEIAEKEVARRQKPEWKKNYADIKAEVENDLAFDPTLMVDKYLRTGETPNGFLKGAKIKLSDEVEGLPKGYTAKGGVEPDALAELFGFQTGDQLVQAIKDLDATRKDLGQTPGKYLEEKVKYETDRRMEAKYGHLEENILDEARELALRDIHIELLNEELKALATQAEIAPPLSREAMTAIIDNNFSGLDIREANGVEKYQRQAWKASRDAEIALLKGKFVDAAKAKQKQLVSFMLAQRAQAFSKEVDKFDKLTKPFTKEVIIKSVDQAYTDQIHKILDAVGIEVPKRTIEGPNLQEFINEKIAEGREIIEPTIPAKNTIAEFTVEEFRDFAEGVESLIHNGREEKTIMIGERKRAYEAAVGEALTNLDALKGTFDPRGKDISSRARKGGRNLLASLVKMEQLFDWIDHNNPKGIFNEIVFKPLSAAEHWKIDTLKDLAKDIKGLKAPTNKELRKKLENNTLLDPDSGTPMNLDREAMLSMALNWGNKSNQTKLLRGWGWEKADVKDFLDKNMTKADWDFVQGTWDVLEKLRPKVEETTRRLTGVAVDLIQPESVSTPHGTFKGGYYPLIEDQIYRINKKPTTQPDLLNDPSFQPLPTASAVHKRTGKMYPLSLELGSLPRRIVETVHYLAFKEPMINAKKLLDDPLIRKGVTEAFGPEYTELFTPWLKHIASDGGLGDTKMPQWLVSLSRAGRINVQTMLIGLNPATALIHGGAAAANSLQEIGFRNIKAFASVFKDVPHEFVAAKIQQIFKSEALVESTFAEVFSKSPELRNRKLKIDDSVAKMWEEALSRNKADGIRMRFTQMSMSLVAGLDMWSAIPTWKVVYDEAILRGFTEKDAVSTADKAVRNAHGASGLVDSARIQRGEEVAKWFTMFIGYFIHNMNRHMDTVRIGRGKNKEDRWGEAMDDFDRTQAVATRSLLYLLIPALVHELVRPHNDKENVASYMAGVLGSQLAGGVPIVRDMMFSLTSGRSGKGTPLADMEEGLLAPFRDIGKMLKGKPPSKNAVKHIVEFPGWAAGLSTRQIGRTAQYWWNVSQGKDHIPVSFSEWYNVMLSGQTKPPKH